MIEFLDDLKKAIVDLSATGDFDSDQYTRDISVEILRARNYCVLKGAADAASREALSPVLWALDKFSQKLMTRQLELEGSLHDWNERLGEIHAKLQKWYDEQAKAPVHQLTDAGIREAVWEMTKGHCAYCGSPLTKFKQDGHSYNFCIEHVVPRSAGGPDNIANYVPACIGCNSSKGGGHVLEFIQGNLNRRPRLVEVPKTGTDA